MNICFFGLKGGASKTTFARLSCEYFTGIRKTIKGNNSAYIEHEKDVLRGVFDNDFNLNVFNVTRHEMSVKKYRSLLDNFKEINPLKKDNLDLMLDGALRKEKNVISIFDIGADAHDQFVELEQEDYGKTFFLNMDIVFIPIKYDDDYVNAAFKATQLLQKYPNISFVYCLTEYQDDLKSSFEYFFNHSGLIQQVNLLQASNRAKVITVPYSKYIRDSASKDQILFEYSKQLKSESEKNYCNKFMQTLFQKFDFVYFNFERDPNVVGEYSVNSSSHNIPFEVMDELSVIKKMISNISNTKIEDTKSDIDINPLQNVMSDIKTSLEKIEIFASPELEEILAQIKEKYASNTKKVFMYIFIATILFPTIVFSTIGYYVGSEVRDSKARNNAQAELKYVNEFSKELYSLGALDVLTIEYSPSRNTASIVCKEETGKCVNRFDPKTNTGYIEIKNAK